MGDSIYQFWSDDQQNFNWLTRVTSRNGEYGLRFRYVDLVCPRCHRFDLDKIFERGFAPHIHIYVKTGRNILRTDDHFLCVSEDLLAHLTREHVGGFEHKGLPETPWHVLRITERRSIDLGALKPSGAKCKTCGRQAQYGTLEYERQVERPGSLLTFFSSPSERGQGGYEVFVTEALADLLKKVGAKGGALHRLYRMEEEALITAKRTKNPTWHPKDSHVFL